MRRRILVEQIAAMTITIAAALVMVVRIVMDGAEADAPLALTIFLAVLFGVLIAVTGYINYMAEYEDGSEHTDRVQHLSAVIGNATATLESLRHQRALLMEEAGIKLADLARTIENAEEHARRTVTTSSTDKAIAVARSYYGSRIPVPAPTFPSSTLTLIKEQAGQLADHHALLETRQEN